MFEKLISDYLRHLTVERGMAKTQLPLTVVI